MTGLQGPGSEGSSTGQGGTKQDVTSSRDEPHPPGSSRADVGPTRRGRTAARAPIGQSVEGAVGAERGRIPGRLFIGSCWLTEGSSAGRGQL